MKTLPCQKLNSSNLQKINNVSTNEIHLSSRFSEFIAEFKYSLRFGLGFDLDTDFDTDFDF